MNAPLPAMKSKSSLWILLALVAAVAWASVETYRLWEATQQVAASQQLEMRVAAKLEAARAKHYQLANTDPSVRGASASQK
jgi:flagellar basal body-associated protein FliL